MVEERLLVRLSGAVAEMLDELVRRGYFSTKSEAIRAGILKLGKLLGWLSSPPITGKSWIRRLSDLVGD